MLNKSVIIVALLATGCSYDMRLGDKQLPLKECQGKGEHCLQAVQDYLRDNYTPTDEPNRVSNLADIRGNCVTYAEAAKQILAMHNIESKRVRCRIQNTYHAVTVANSFVIDNLQRFVYPISAISYECKL